MESAPKRSRLRRNFWIIFWLVAAYGAFGFFAAPSLIQEQLQKRGSEKLGRKVTVEHVKVNPFALSLTLENLNVRELDGTDSFLNWTRLHVNVDLLPSLIGDWTIKVIELDGFSVSTRLRKDGTFNFADILAKLVKSSPEPAAKSPEEPPHPVRVGRLTVTNASVNFADDTRAQPFQTRLGPLTFELNEFRTLGARGGDYQFQAVSEAGESFSWSGMIAADPVSSVGKLKLENVVVGKYLTYFGDLLGLEVAQGRLSVQGNYRMNLADPLRVMKFSEGVVQLRDLKAVLRGETEPTLELRQLEVKGIEADGISRKAEVASVELTGGKIKVRREKDGSINVLKAREAALGANPAAKSVSSGSGEVPPKILIEEVVLAEVGMTLRDLTTARPAEIGLDVDQGWIKQVTLDEGAIMPLMFSLRWQPRGLARVDGTMQINPELKIALNTSLELVHLQSLSPYLEEVVNARLSQGAVSSTGHLDLAMKAGQPQAVFTGDLSLHRLALVEGAVNEELAGFNLLAFTGVRLETGSPLTASIGAINLVEPYARIAVRPDKTLNLANLLKKAPPPAPAPLSVGPASAPAAAPRIDVGRVTVSDGDFRILDQSLEPNVRLSLTQLRGSVSSMSSVNPKRADVEIKAAVDGVSPILISGQLDPLGAKKFAAIKVDFKSVDLLPLSPYSGRYAGFELARGKLAVDVNAKLDDKKLESSNVITLSQFTFGEPVQSPDATKLPVRLGVALLKDLNGQIVIDVPVAGNVGDPEFHIGRVVGRVIINLLTKAAVSPFALLGSMFGGGGEELAFQEFSPGATTLQETEIKKLETMVKAMNNRPGLSLAIEGGYDPVTDTAALKQQKLLALVRSRLWEEQRVTNPNLPPPDELVVSPEMQAATIEKLYNEKFPPAPALTPVAQVAPVEVAPPPPEPVVVRKEKPRRGFFRRLFTFGGRDDEEEVRQPAPPPVSVPPPTPPVVAIAAPVAAPPSPEEMAARLIETITVDENNLRALASARALRVMNYFLVQGGVSANRLFLAKIEDPAKASKGAKVFLSLQ